MLPFLKNGEYSSVTGEDDPIKRASDDPEQYDMLNAVAEDMLAAGTHRNVHLMKDALSAFAEHLMEMFMEKDAKQDSRLMKSEAE